MELTNKLVYTVRNELFPSNTYILKNKDSNICILIDPGLDSILIDQKITDLDLLPIAIISTHGHFDHISGVSFFQDKYKIPFYLHEADLKLSQSANFYLKIARVPVKIQTPKPDYLFKGKLQETSIGDFKLSIYNLPGHSPGSCVVRYENYLFSGDIIYKKGLGFNNFPGEDKRKLRESILEMFNIFPMDNLLFPGHGEAEYLDKIRENNKDLINFLNAKQN